MEVAIQEYFGWFFIAEWKESSLKWNGQIFDWCGFNWAKKFETERAVVDECKANGFKIFGFVSSPHLSKEDEQRIWKNIQALSGVEA